jgi:hypothetical protein
MAGFFVFSADPVYPIRIEGQLVDEDKLNQAAEGYVLAMERPLLRRFQPFLNWPCKGTVRQG